VLDRVDHQLTDDRLGFVDQFAEAPGLQDLAGEVAGGASRLGRSGQYTGGDSGCLPPRGRYRQKPRRAKTRLRVSGAAHSQIVTPGPGKVPHPRKLLVVITMSLQVRGPVRRRVVVHVIPNAA
jgi:hypothetical protein